MPRRIRWTPTLDNPAQAFLSPRLSRRSLMSMAAAACAVPRAALAVPSPPPALRRLQLVNAHTGERFDGPYRDDSGPVPAAMTELSAFLRDFHCGAEIAYDVAVIDFLAAVLDAIAEPSATILSAYRTPETNAMLARTTFGVAEHSQHMFGRALDIYVGGKLERAVSAARAMRRGGVGWYPRSNFMHVDSGPVRNWNLDDNGMDRLLLPDDAGHNDHLPAGTSGQQARTGGQARTAGVDGRRRSPIGGDSGELFPEVAEQHPSLTTQQLLARFQARRG